MTVGFIVYFFVRGLINIWSVGIHERQKQTILLMAVMLVCLHGYLQWLTILTSLNSNNPFTGFFSNVGPYAIFLAVLLPLVIQTIFSGCTIAIQRFGLVVFCLLLVLLIASASRTAWLSSIIAVIYLFRTHVLRLIKHLLKRQYVLTVFIVIAFGLSLYLLYQFKSASAKGRLFTWRRSLEMIRDHWIIGNGASGFRINYGKYLHHYFSTHTENWNEILIAEPCHYAFNDFIQRWVEQGIIGFGLLIAIFITAMVIPENKVGMLLKPSIVVVGVASCFSYPLQLPALFFLLMIILVNLSARQSKYCLRISSRNIYLGLALFIVLFVASTPVCSVVLAKKKFKALTRQRFLNKDIRPWAALYPSLQHDDEFVVLYAKLLYHSGQYLQSNALLVNNSHLPFDPFAFILMGDNYVMLNQYDSAINAYDISSKIDPKLLYPRYLLHKAYLCAADTAKALHCAQALLKVPVKVASPATEQMRWEMTTFISRFPRVPNY